ncbi:DUF5777 family beta-barrel protein [Sungkyunkwania multivorans]|uniref:DUF5777 family beta-barrel protein n=1 Tax=Sungkyunkwania multivorans TaxID=1173618 RepID=A0ABW3CXJ9_9FLAO
MRTRIFSLLLLLSAATSSVVAQDLLEILDNERKVTSEYTTATFKFSRITFGHAVETRKDGTLDVFVSSRFWNTPADRSQSFFAERLSSRIAIEYGLSDRFLVGVGGTTFDGRFDGFLKYKLLRQRADGKGSPFSMSLFQNMSYFSEGLAANGFDVEDSNRTSFTTQLLIARKFSPRFSFQLSPTFVHRGLVYEEEDPQSHFALGFGGRYRLGGHVFLVSEYYYVANPIRSVDTYGAFSLGVNWELSDVMLQFMLTNAQSMVEDAFIVDTRNNFNFKAPNLNFGFHFTYTFHLKKELKLAE